ncbi:MAG: hypothetical protein NZ805_08905, partial [Armatimonadetes bacterium]|nr:hypothetical protein [Armatimonadota bacterium]
MIWSLLVVMLVVCVMMAVAEAVDLVRDGKPRASIVASSEGPTSYAAEVLQRYIERMSGAKLPIISEGQKSVGTKILFRVHKGAAKFDGFRIKASKD